MQILTFTQFCALPAGTIFSYYEPAICTGLQRKGETIYHDGQPRDFFESYLVPQCWNGDAPTVDPVEARWAEYNENQLFAVLDPSDIQTLHHMLGNSTPPPSTHELH